MIIFTSICANYAHKARCLAESVRAHLPEARFLICLTEREVPENMKKNIPGLFDEIVLAKDMWNGNFNRFIFKHAIVEASTAVKGRFFQYLMERFPGEDAYIYLDPDCYVYGDFKELREALTRKPIVLCPHLLHPGNIDMELSSTAHGVYNLGFLAVKDDPEAHRLIDWWAERLYKFCYDDIPNGIFTDQKWMDLAPCFFDVEIFHHYGYDFAPWGLLGCKVEQRGENWFVQDMPLNFIHYSGFGPVAEMCMDRWLSEEGTPFRTLYAEYSSAHDRNNEDCISTTPWSYGSYTSGKAVSLDVRERYRKDWDLMFSVEDPFALSDEYFHKVFAEKDEQQAAREREEKKRQEAALEQLRKGRIERLAKASIRTFREEGFSAVLNKIYIKVKGKLTREE